MNQNAIVIGLIVLVFTIAINKVNAVVIVTPIGDCVAIIDTGKESEQKCMDQIRLINETNAANQSPSEITKANELQNITK